VATIHVGATPLGSGTYTGLERISTRPEDLTPQYSERTSDSVPALTKALGTNVVGNVNWLTGFEAPWLIDPVTTNKLRISRWLYQPAARCLVDIHGIVNEDTRRKQKLKVAACRLYNAFLIANDEERRGPAFSELRERWQLTGRDISELPGADRRPIGFIAVQMNADVDEDLLERARAGEVIEELQLAPTRAADSGEHLDFAGQHARIDAPRSAVQQPLLRPRDMIRDHRAG
jgi:hypothetical protein